MCDGRSWHNLGREAEWRATVGCRAVSPFHQVDRNPLLHIPGLSAMTILPDSCHVFHLGWGIDLAASGVVLCAKLKVFPGRSLDRQLQNAFSKFLAWCTKNKKTTAIGWWSYKKFDMTTLLDSLNTVLYQNLFG